MSWSTTTNLLTQVINEIRNIIPVRVQEDKPSEIAHLKKLLAMAEASRLEAQTDYQQMRVKYQQLNQEKELLEHLLTEKNKLIMSEMTIWLSSKSILKYYEGQWRDRMGLKISHEGLITGFEYAND